MTIPSRLRLIVPIAGLMLSAAPPARATKCIPPTPAAPYAGAIFEAKVVGKQSTGFRLSVAKVYRGEVPRMVSVIAHGMKGYSRLKVGKRFLVYARGDASSLVVHLCGPTHELPRSGRFVSGPWLGFTPEKIYGKARSPGTKIELAFPARDAGADTGAAADADNDADATTAPGPSATTSASPAAPAPRRTVDLAPPRKNAVRPEPTPVRSGCTGCAVATNNQRAGGLLGAALALFALGVRRRVASTRRI